MLRDLLALFAWFPYVALPSLLGHFLLIGLCYLWCLAGCFDKSSFFCHELCRLSEDVYFFLFLFECQCEPSLFASRSHKEKRSSYAPETGVRYDGVYRIEKCWRKNGIQVNFQWQSCNASKGNHGLYTC